jgi:SAM-dependent methyltransferase
MGDTGQYFEANKNIWNQRTTVHKDSSFYDLAGFKAGTNSPTPIEINEIGDVKSKSLLHLQCHFGMDTMSFSRMGAKCVGVDLSDEAIRLAGEINDELKLDVRFICCNVYDTSKYVEEQFDIVFTSYGVISWLPDLIKWAQVIVEKLKPGGIFYMAEFHPVIWMFDEEFTHVKYYYDNREVIITENEGTYTDRNADIKGKEYSWNHSISEVLNALINAGLKIEFFNEHMYSPYPCFRNAVETETGKWHIRGMEGKIPMVYSLRARKSD